MHDLQFTLNSFLEIPIDEVAQVAPNTIIYSVSGTRRRAALAGVPTQGDGYTTWTGSQMIKCLQVIFSHGVKNIVTPMLTPSQFNEVTPKYRENLWSWLDEGLTSPEMLSIYRDLGWRVRIPFANHLPKLHKAVRLLEKTTINCAAHNLWILIVPKHNVLWEWALQDLLSSHPRSPEDAIHAIYGESIPPATLYLDFGKPVVSPDLLPPFLAGKLECYWTQQPGYSLDAKQFRTILYDYAFVRKTWQADKTGRAEQAEKYREAWESGPVLGLGTRLGPFWYPQPILAPNHS